MCSHNQKLAAWLTDWQWYELTTLCEAKSKTDWHETKKWRPYQPHGQGRTLKSETLKEIQGHVMITESTRNIYTIQISNCRCKKPTAPCLVFVKPLYFFLDHIAYTKRTEPAFTHSALKLESPSPPWPSTVYDRCAIYVTAYTLNT